jgi:hypothetical protein
VKDLFPAPKLLRELSFRDVGLSIELNSALKKPDQSLVGRAFLDL